MQEIKVKEADLDAAGLLPQMELGPKDNVALNYLLDAVFSIAAQVLLAVYIAFSVILCYYHQANYAFQRYFLFSSRTPQSIRKETAGFLKVPRHVAFILDGSTFQGVETVLNAILEGTMWCVGAGSPEVTFYERSGVLKQLDPESLAEAVATNLARYFRTREELPEIIIRRNGVAKVYSNGNICEPKNQADENRGTQNVTDRTSNDTLEQRGSTSSGNGKSSENEHRPTLEITLASEEDGRPMLVLLAQEYAVSISAGKLVQSDITVNKIHKELQERVGNEPDLLVTFGSRLDLAGFSPWLVRVTELFCLPDNNGIFHYMVFYRALQKFAKIKVNLGA